MNWTALKQGTKLQTRKNILKSKLQTKTNWKQSKPQQGFTKY